MKLKYGIRQDKPKRIDKPTHRIIPIGVIHLVENTQKHHAADNEYYCIHCKLNNKRVVLMLTDVEIENAFNRAVKNAEDIPRS